MHKPHLNKLTTFALIAAATAAAIWGLSWYLWEALDLWQYLANTEYTHLLYAVIGIQAAGTFALSLHGKPEATDLKPVYSGMAELDRASKQRSRELMDRVNSLDTAFKDLRLFLKLKPNKQDQTPQKNNVEEDSAFEDAFEEPEPEPTEEETTQDPEPPKDPEPKTPKKNKKPPAKKTTPEMKTDPDQEAPQ